MGCGEEHFGCAVLKSPNDAIDCAIGGGVENEEEEEEEEEESEENKKKRERRSRGAFAS